MGKSTKFTVEALEKMGLTLNEDGTYSRKKEDKLTLFVPDNTGGIYDTKKMDVILKQKVNNDNLMICDEAYESTFEITRGNTFPVKQKVNESPDFEHKVCTEWFITYNVPSKKNSRINFIKNGKQISLPSKNHAEYKKVTAIQYNVFGIEFRKAINHFGLKPPFKVEFTFVRSTKHRFDYCNAAQTCEDLFTENKWIEDDSADFLIPSFKPYRYDKNNPGVHIKLLK